MPDWISNRFTAVGQPEVLAELSIFCAQFIAPYLDSKKEVVSSSIPMNQREELDLSFWTSVRNENIDETGFINRHWGTKWDVCGRVYQGGSDGTRNFHPHEVLAYPYHKDFDVTFSTAWGPAVGFVEQISATFPDVTIALTYDDGEDVENTTSTFLNGWSSSEVVFDEAEPEPDDDENDDEYQERIDKWKNDRQRTINSEHDRVINDADIGERTFHPLISLVLLNDVKACEEWLNGNPSDLNTHLNSQWCAIHHAAYSGYEQVFNMLVGMGANTDLRTNSAAAMSLVDILLDIRGTEADTLLAAKKRMFSTLLSISPSLINDPLATGLQTIELIARWGMREQFLLAAPSLDKEISSPIGRATHHLYFKKDVERSKLLEVNPYTGSEFELPAWVEIMSSQATAPAQIAMLGMLRNDLPEALPAVASLMMTYSVLNLTCGPGLGDDDVFRQCAEILSNAGNKGIHQIQTQLFFDNIYDQLAKPKDRMDEGEKAKIPMIHSILRSASVRMEATTIISEMLMQQHFSPFSINKR